MWDHLCAATEDNDADLHGIVAWLDGGGGVDARCAERGGRTLLMAAAGTMRGHGAIVRLLLLRGASVNLQASDNGTALMAAAAYGHPTIVRVLLDANADASMQTKSGNTAIMVAEALNMVAEASGNTAKHTEIAQLLRHHANLYPTLLGCRVCIAGLKGRPELNGRCGVARRFDAAKGRYEVAVEGEAEAVLLKPANLQEFLEPAPSGLTLTPILTLALIQP